MRPSDLSVISFPSLGIELNPGRMIEIGPLTIHYYGAIIALGLMLAVLYCSHRAKEFGLTEDNVLDGVLCVTPFAILCARAYYVAFSWEEFAHNPISALYIWAFCKWKKIKMSATLDLVLLGFLIGQSIGRWGNFFNREAFGAETDTFLRMGLYNTVTGVTRYFHPTFLYESVWNAIGFVLLHFASKRRLYDGQTAWAAA